MIYLGLENNELLIHMLRQMILQHIMISKSIQIYLWWWWFSHQVVSVSCDPMDCSLPGSSVHRISQARILEWVAISFSKIYLYLHAKEKFESPILYWYKLQERAKLSTEIDIRNKKVISWERVRIRESFLESPLERARGLSVTT